MLNTIIPFYNQINTSIVRGQGCYLYDSNNKEYIDFESGDWAATLGHSNEQIAAAIKKQAETIVHDGLRFRNNLAEKLSELLVEKLNLSGGKSAFLNSGSEAVNLAITIAKKLTKRTAILKLDGTYLSAFGHGQISENNQELLSIPLNDFDTLSNIDFDTIAGFAFEPGNSWGLVKFPFVEFINAIALKVKKSGGLLIANEVTTGFGRTGKWFGFQHYNYNPDIVAMGKALGNGYPISAVSISNATSDLFDRNSFRYAQSHQNDPLGCAVGLEVIRIYDENLLIDLSCNKGYCFKEALSKLQNTYTQHIKEIRARGLMLAVEFYSHINAERIYNQLLEMGLIVGYKENTLRFMPPIIIEKTHINQLISAIDSCISQITR
jgi:acetylornithine aminotransferase